MTRRGGEAADDRVGTILAGRYRIVERLGEGAMGAVYLGEHVKLGRRDAIKVLRESLARDAETIARFTRGARSVSAIQHPNVCTIYDFGDTEDGVPFLAMEYVAGESLKDVLDRESRLPLHRALAIAQQVASGLDAAHGAGIIHRDLKPGNIILFRARDGREQVKVVDFDIAKMPETGPEEVTRSGFVVGTPEYMSPEQLTANPLDGRSDVYSLALLLFRMLAGRLPFRAETSQEVMIERLTMAPLTLAEALPGVPFPARLGSLLDRALSWQPADRVASAHELERELSALLDARGAAKAGAAPSNGARPRRTALFTGGTALVILAGLGGALLARQGHQVPPTSEPAAAAGPRAAESRREPVPALADTPPRSQQDRAARANPSEERAARPSETPGMASEVAGATPHERSDPSPTMPVDARRASDVLFRQLDRLTTAHPSDTRSVDAVVDTAFAMLQMYSLPDRHRALAAYILGSAYDVRQEWARCVTWLDAALTLDPQGPGFSELRTKCRESSR